MNSTTAKNRRFILRMSARFFEIFILIQRKPLIFYCFFDIMQMFKLTAMTKNIRAFIFFRESALV